MILYSAYYRENDPFKIFDRVCHVIDKTELKNDGALVLWGGSDISPSLYNQEVVHANAQKKPSERDIIEAELFKQAVKLGMPIIGICRGAQLACALSGGTVYQHIERGHHNTHKVETKDGHVFYTSSCHHQALNTKDLPQEDFEVLAWDFNRVTRVFTDKDSDEIVIPEVVHFKKARTFAIQGHPEWMNPDDPFVKWCNMQMKERIL